MKLLIPIILIAAATAVRAAEHVAAGVSTAQVQAAVDAASDGDTVLIPNGSATWTTGIDTNKQIIIRAQNYTPTPAGTAGSGTTSRNVTITNNSSAPLFAFNTGNTAHCGLGGIRFNEGTGTVNHVRFEGSGTKPGLLFDCYMQVKQRNGNSSDVCVVGWLGQGGIMWNCVLSADGFTGGGASPFGVDGASIVIKSTRAWTTASTMGVADSGGIVNVYIEACTFLNIGQCPDVDVQGRAVLRYCNFDGSWGLTHGFGPTDTPPSVGRHTEHYNNIFQVTHNSPPYRAIANRYFWNRGGTSLFTDNTLNTPANTSEWGNVQQIQIGDSHASPSGYPTNMQPGYGHNGSAHVSDPIYIWNESGARAYTYGFIGTWGTVVQAGRDLFVNSGAKSGYSKYTYPHPLRSAIEGGGGDTTPPVLTSATINAAGTTITLAFNEATTRNSGTPTVSLSGGACTLTYSSGSGTTSHVYTLSRTVDFGETGTLSASLGSNVWEDAAGNDVAAISGATVTNNSTQGQPTLTSATINADGDEMTLGFSENVTRNSGTPTVSLSLGACTLTYSSGSGTSSHVYSLSRTVYAPETGTLSASLGANVWEDASGNDVAAISNFAITNNSTQVAPSVTWYVDQTAGNDSNAGTSTGAPLKNCPGMQGTSAHTGGKTLSAGDTVYLDRSDTWLVSSGSTGGLVIVGGVTYIGNVYDPESAGTGRAILRANGRCEAAGIRMSDDDPAYETAVVGIEVDGDGNTGSGIGCNHPFWTTGLLNAKRVEDCYVHGWEGDGGGGDYTYGIIVSDASGDASGMVSNFSVINCTVTSAPRDGICLYPAAGGRVTNSLVRGCTVSGVKTDDSYSEGHGILVKGDVQDSIVEYNYVTGVNSSALFVNGPEGGDDPGPTGLVVRFNILSTNDDNGVIRVYGTGTKSMDIYGNICSGTSPSGGMSFAADEDVTDANVFNNTFLLPILVGNPTSTGTITFMNNIIYVGNAVPFTDSGADIDIHHNNIYFRSAGTTLVSSGGSSYTAGTLATYEASGINANPSFTNPSNPPTGFTGTYPDLEPNTDGLQPTTAAVNSGTDVTPLSNGSINGVARPSGGGWDIGAYELEEGSDIDAPQLLSATITANGLLLILAFDEDVYRSDGTPTLSLSGGDVTATYAYGSGSPNHGYNLSRVVSAIETGTVDADLDADDWEDFAGNDVDDISAAVLTNESAVAYPPNRGLRKLRILISDDAWNWEEWLAVWDEGAGDRRFYQLVLDPE